MVLACIALAIVPMYRILIERYPGPWSGRWITLFDHVSLPPNIDDTTLSWQLLLKRVTYVSLVSAIILVSCFKYYRFRWLSTLGMVLLAGFMVVNRFRWMGKAVHPLGYGLLALFVLLAIMLLVLQVLVDYHRKVNGVSH